ncbi:MAG: hypothetical protein HGA45_23435 [Chloroflexales bacterium]|nr:hypothetical protein [Chloroflexales bacterium]
MRDSQPTAGEGTGATPDKGSLSAPAITLPKGGGAIRGIGEKFAANPNPGVAVVMLASLG